MTVTRVTFGELHPTVALSQQGDAAGSGVSRVSVFHAVDGAVSGRALKLSS